jgi:hypothetical protein
MGHCVNNHGSLLCFTDRKWHILIGLLVLAGVTYAIGFLLAFASGEKFHTASARENWWLHDRKAHAKLGWFTRPF